MIASGFTNAPITRILLILVVLLSILASITDTKYYFPISIRPHILAYRQFWRLLTWQTCYTNSTEVLFSAMTIYQLRVIERLWGSRKFLSFLIATAPYTLLLPPLTLALLNILTLGRLNVLPSGPTALVFALLAQYHAAIPYNYKYSLSYPVPSPSTTSAGSGSGSLMITSKAISYLLPAQLALSSLPGSLIPAISGWVIGYAYRLDLLPGAYGWRIPDFDSERREREKGFEEMRRRMEGEVGDNGTGAGTGSTVDAAGGQGQGGRTARRRGVAGAILDQFRGVF